MIAGIRLLLARFRTKYDIGAFWTTDWYRYTLEARAAVRQTVFFQQYGNVRLLQQDYRIGLEVHIGLGEAALVLTVIKVQSFLDIVFGMRRVFGSCGCLLTLCQLCFGFDVLREQFDHNLGISLQLLSTFQWKLAFVQCRESVSENKFIE